MGENAFIAFGLTAMGISWPQALGAVFVSGVLFLLLKLATGRGRELSGGQVALALLCAVYYVFGLPH